jgi:hypothetical protein
MIIYNCNFQQGIVMKIILFILLLTFAGCSNYPKAHDYCKNKENEIAKATCLENTGKSDYSISDKLYCNKDGKEEPFFFKFSYEKCFSDYLYGDKK